ncbi:MAG: trypsin-like peptidase domain-containing protein [Anaerolineales bacterium]|nr:trypsin-like peptidase domain-containing protein [Anaerolineales bacterium]
MIKKPTFRILSALTALTLASMACGIGGNTGGDDPTEAPKPTESSEQPTAEPQSSGGAINSWEDAENATIQILAEGSFVDPAEGFQANAVGAGSGFLISSDGLAVTNNHVVTGSARLKVYLNGEEYRAKVLGASECWDLAVIQIDGEDLPFMEPYEGGISVGTEVYSAGFPLGDPEFTLTRGIISKENADGESNWASVDSVVQHDARINPGNSGGPLINEDGQVVGVNYAGNASTDQNFAIMLQDAQDVIEQLTDGIDVDSIGINGQAVMSEDGSIQGIWVSSVKSGSAADRTGISGGDIIIEMEGVSVGRGGAMTDYCDILRSHDAGSTLSISVLRFATSEVLEGQLNGRELTQSFSFGGQVDENTTGSTEVDPGGFYTISDDTGSLQVDLPNIWSEVDTSTYQLAGEYDVARIQALDGGFEAGVEFGVSSDLAQLGGYVQFLDLYRDEVYNPQCSTYEGRSDVITYGDFEGQYDLFSGCDDGPQVVVLSMRPASDQTAYLIYVIGYVYTDGDFDLLDSAISSMVITGGNLP